MEWSRYYKLVADVIQKLEKFVNGERRKMVKGRAGIAVTSEDEFVYFNLYIR